ncbi:MAG: hypothetical protein ACRDT6_20810 [Micromonosporaceae bacterium]
MIVAEGSLNEGDRTLCGDRIAAAAIRIGGPEDVTCARCIAKLAGAAESDGVEPE